MNGITRGVVPKVGELRKGNGHRSKVACQIMYAGLVSKGEEFSAGRMGPAKADAISGIVHVRFGDDLQGLTRSNIGKDIVVGGVAFDKSRSIQEGNIYNFAYKSTNAVLNMKRTNGFAYD
jgi:hypothetical protein